MSPEHMTLGPSRLPGTALGNSEAERKWVVMNPSLSFGKDNEVQRSQAPCSRARVATACEQAQPRSSSCDSQPHPALVSGSQWCPSGVMDAIQPRLLAHCPHLLHPTFQAADSLSLLCRTERSSCDVRGCEGLSVKDCGKRSGSRARGPALSKDLVQLLRVYGGQR